MSSGVKNLNLWKSDFASKRWFFTIKVILYQIQYRYASLEIVWNCKFSPIWSDSTLEDIFYYKGNNFTDQDAYFAVIMPF